MNCLGCEVVVYDCYYLDIPLQDIPDIGHIIVCKDPQRLHPEKETWVVSRMIGDQGAFPHALGLFWDKEEAEFYAKALTTFKGE